MIYALLDVNKPHADCVVIARAILNHNGAIIQQWVKAGAIVHVERANVLPGPFYCLYCRDAVHASPERPPKGLVAANRWHFEYEREAGCIGHARTPPTPHALGVLNPVNHGCYVLLGCETSPKRHRTQCQTIDAGRTYCHLARTMNPPCV